MDVADGKRRSRRDTRAAVGPRGDTGFRLETHIFYLFSTILARRNRMLNAELARFGIDYPRWRVLAVLGQHPGASMLQLAELTSVDRTTLAHTVRLMVGEDLVSRRARQSDRRSVTLRLTRHGRRVLRQILPLVVAQNEMAISGLDARQAARLCRQLHRILGNLR